MKTIITLSALALMSNLAIAENFTYEQQIASPDLSDQDFSSSERLVSTREVRVSLDSWSKGNPDMENVPYSHDGIVISSPGQLTAYEELSRENPDLGGV